MGNKRKRAIDLWNSGCFTMQQIGKQLGLSRERIRQFVEDAIRSNQAVLSAKEWQLHRKVVREASIDCVRTSKLWDMPLYTTVSRNGWVKVRLKRIINRWRCEKCGWHKYPIALVIHHIDKNRRNNDPNNLMLLCPNCHWFIHQMSKDFSMTSKGRKRQTGSNYTEHLYKKRHAIRSI
jgi:hypothetical protein